jgi:BirA family biotin operon repressor/biotin-[acetyl-CoA-carboxylase] ligase
MPKQSTWEDVLVELDVVDSTNNYAIKCISEGLAGHGWAVRANFQTAGRGQLGHNWESDKGKNILCSLVLDMLGHDLRRQFVLNACLCSAIIATLRAMPGLEEVYIKWPNDIYYRGKKLGGILIENQIRGAIWTHAILGFGINVNQTHFQSTENGISIQEISGHPMALSDLTRHLLNNIKNHLKSFLEGSSEGLVLYNSLLGRRGEALSFYWNNTLFRGILQGVGDDGRIQLDISGSPHFFMHKEITWSESAWMV